MNSTQSQNQRIYINQSVGNWECSLLPPQQVIIPTSGDGFCNSLPIKMLEKKVNHDIRDVRLGTGTHFRFRL